VKVTNANEMLQLEMYQPLYDEQQLRQSTQSTGAAQPSAPAVCERYASGQSKVAGILLIIAGTLSIVFNVAAIILLEIWTYFGQGFWCGIMVSSNCTLWLFL